MSDNIEVLLSVCLMCIYLLLIAGGVYASFHVLTIGGIAPFLFVVFIPVCWPVLMVTGAWAIMFGFPDWFYNVLGAV